MQRLQLHHEKRKDDWNGCIYPAMDSNHIGANRIMNKIQLRILKWIQSWITLIDGLIGIFTLGLYDPQWGIPITQRIITLMIKMPEEDF